MIAENEVICPNCGSDNLIHYDTVTRVVRTKGRKTNRVRIRRLRCKGCRRVHREIPSYIYPYKQYESEVIDGVIDGYISPETLGFEDYPCELTMLSWIDRLLQQLVIFAMLAQVLYRFVMFAIAVHACFSWYFMT